MQLGGSNHALRTAVVGSKVAIRRHPLAAKALPTAIGFAFGDVLTQTLSRKQQQQQQGQGQQHDDSSSSSASTSSLQGPGQAAGFDFGRTAKMAALGAVVAGPVGLAFFRWMNVNVLPGSPRIGMGVKVLLDQALGCVLWQAAFLSISAPYRTAAAGLLQTTHAGLHGRTSGIRRKLLPAVA